MNTGQAGLNMTSELAQKMTVRDIVIAWNSACDGIREASRIIKQSEKTLLNGVNHKYSFSLRYHTGKLADPEAIISEMRISCWNSIIDRMEIRPLLSIHRAKELEKKIYAGEMPEITEETVMDMLRGALANIGTFIEEQVREVHEYLRPRQSKYKTNTEFDIGKRVVLTYGCRQKWNGTGYDTNEHTVKHLRSLDNVFHHLDGQGLPDGYLGPLLTAIQNTGHDGLGETEYFKVKCYKNGNIHLEFKRLDLVKNLNAIAGGMTFYRGQKESVPETGGAEILKVCKNVSRCT